MSGSDKQRHEHAEAVFDAWLVKQLDGKGASRDEFLAAHEGLRDILGQMLTEMDFAEGLLNAGDRKVSKSKVDQPPSEKRSGRDALGDFQLIRELGRGGMGVVYEAHQLSLDRTVALAAATERRKLGIDARPV
ncbi:MAG: hypothetical protein CMJ98_12980 [Planctomycetes bacterium]|nr:hypothetical protein [Planctomycetota bacterium]